MPNANTGFTDTQKEALAAKLDGATVKTRKQGGQELSYIEGWHAIAEANRIFGFDGWDRETVMCTCVWSGERKTKSGDKPAASYVARVRVTARAGSTIVIREGTGAGSGFGNDHGEAHESAIKEAETDAMKRALMTFGNPFGLALYDKDKENVESANAQGGGKPDPKAMAAEMVKALNGAVDLPALDGCWDAMREDLQTLPREEQDRIGGIFDQNAVRVFEAQFAAAADVVALTTAWKQAQNYTGPMAASLKGRLTAAKDDRKRALMSDPAFQRMAG